MDSRSENSGKKITLSEGGYVHTNSKFKKRRRGER
jgi:hypothetical protein